MIIALVCGSRGLGSRPGWVTELCFWEKHFTLTMPLSTQENLVNCHLLRGNLVMTGIPWRGGGGRSGDTPCRFKRRKLGQAPVGRATWLQYRLNLFFLNDYNKYSVIQLSFKTTEFYHLNSPSGVLKYLLWNRRKRHVFATIWTV